MQNLIFPKPDLLSAIPPFLEWPKHDGHETQAHCKSLETTTITPCINSSCLLHQPPRPPPSTRMNIKAMDFDFWNLDQSAEPQSTFYDIINSSLEDMSREPQTSFHGHHTVTHESEVPHGSQTHLHGSPAPGEWVHNGSEITPSLDVESTEAGSNTTPTYQKPKRCRPPPYSLTFRTRHDYKARVVPPNPYGRAGYKRCLNCRNWRQKVRPVCCSA